MSTIRRLFSTEALSGSGALVRLDSDESHHGWNVLRLREGDRVHVFDGTGAQYAATVRGFEKKRLIVVLEDPAPAAPEPPVSLSLSLALTKAEAFDNVLQRAVELGASEVVPFIAERSVPNLGRDEAFKKKIARWRQILLGATKQCGRARLTAITPPLSFEDALCHPGASALRLCCSPDPSVPRMSEVLRSFGRKFPSHMAVMLGPEGGLSPEEVALARDRGWRLVSLGSRILRVQTAATAALALVLGELGEL